MVSVFITLHKLKFLHVTVGNLSNICIILSLFFETFIISPHDAA